MDIVDEKIRRTLKDSGDYYYLAKYPWLTGYIGNPKCPIWFIGENPSLRGLEKIQIPEEERTENLQWNSHKGDKLLREGITEAGLKKGDPEKNEGWMCYITNAIKQPEKVKERNDQKKKNSSYWKEQALLWMPVLNLQIDNGKPKVLVALGNETLRILRFMKANGLIIPTLEQIPHYSYIMFRPDPKTGLGPGHPDRMKDFKQTILRIKKQYYA